MADKILLSRTDGKGKKLLLKIVVSVKDLPDATANVVGLWREDTSEIIGHTEIINATEGTFASEFHLDHYMAADLPIKFCVYSVTKEPLDETCFVGSHVSTLQSFFKKKQQEHALEGAGTISFRATVLADPNAPKKEKKVVVETGPKLSPEEAKAKKAAEKLVKLSAKEGGKKGQDLCGMSTFGVHFFLTSMDSMGDDWNLMDAAMAGMNKPVDPDGDDRKGGAGDLAKVLFCAGPTKLLISCHVPVEQHEGSSCKDFFEAVCKPVGAVVVSQDEFYAKAEVLADPDNNKYPLKLKDEAIAAGFQYLRDKGLILDDESDDDINFADDCGVDLNAGAEGSDY